jgi:hypothetical protein
MRQVLAILAWLASSAVVAGCSNCCPTPDGASSARALRDDPLQPPTAFKRFKLTNADADTPKKDITAASATRYTDGSGSAGATAQPLVPSSACAPVATSPLTPMNYTTCPEGSVIEIRSVTFTLTVKLPDGSTSTRTSSLYAKAAAANDPYYAPGAYKYIESVDATYTGTAGALFKADVVVNYWKKPQDPTKGTEPVPYPNQTF